MDYETAIKNFRYCRDSGVLYWAKTRSNRAVAGTECGHFDGVKFSVNFDGKGYVVSRLVWLIVNKEWPTGRIQHLDGDKLNTRIENLQIKRKMSSGDITPGLFSNIFFLKDGLLHRVDTGEIVSRTHTVSAFGFSWTKCYVVWLLAYGRWPERDIEHINGDSSDDRLCNIRELPELKFRDVPVEDFSREFKYDPESGQITIDGCDGPIIADEVIKSGKDTGKYRILYFSGKNWKSHRVAWLLHYGKWPDGQIDHINHNGLDNRIANLRDVDRSGNARNLPIRSDNKSGVTGVYESASGRYRSTVRADGKIKHLGTFDTIEEAAAARRKVLDEQGYHENHGN